MGGALQQNHEISGHAHFFFVLSCHAHFCATSLLTESVPAAVVTMQCIEKKMVSKTSVSILYIDLCFNFIAVSN